MPCDSSGYPTSGHDYEAHKEIKYLKSELDSVTSMLCSILHAWEASGTIFPPNIQKWYEAHKAWDKSQGRP